MRTLQLVDEQPMETLPKEEEILFVEVTNRYDERYVTKVMGSLYHNGYYYGIYDTFHAWSYTATYAEEPQP